jgi:hypothetical protein
MRLSSKKLINAKEATRNLLEAMGLDAYLYEVEPRENPWLVRVDCAVEGGWQSISIDVEVEDLIKSRKDKELFGQLLEQWGKHFDNGES